MPIVETLAKDHRELERIVSELAQTPSREPERRLELFARLQALVQSHSRAEEEVVYRRLRERLPEEGKTLEAFEEHHLADVLLQELASNAPGGPGWSAKSKVFEEILRHHIKEEELDIFALIGEHFDDAAREQMDIEFRTLKHERLEAALWPLRRMTPAFVGRALITAQAAAGRYARRGERLLRQRTGVWPAQTLEDASATIEPVGGERTQAQLRPQAHAHRAHRHEPARARAKRRKAAHGDSRSTPRVTH